MVLPSETSSPAAGPIEAPRAAPAVPPSRPPARRSTWRKWRARFIVLLLLAAAVLVFIRISGDRATESNRVDLGEAILTAQAVPIETVQTGRVSSVLVTALQRVSAGQRVGAIEVLGADADGDPKITKVNLTAPRAGTVIDVPAPVGSTLEAGVPFLQLYDPAQLTFVSKVRLEDLPVIAPTMTAVLHTEGMKRAVHVRVQRVVPRVPGAEASGDDPDALQIVLVPASLSEVQGLVPGMHFTGYINTVSGEPGIVRLVSLPALGQ